MARPPTTARRRRRPPAFLALAAATALPEAAGAGPGIDEIEALAHARAVAAAYRRLETHILADAAAATSWSGAIPPAATGWLQSWTLRGLEARYCDDTLLVYLAPAELKGVGRDHRAVQAAPHLFAKNGGENRLAGLHWLEAGRARGTVGRATVSLPACLSGPRFGGPFPTERAALAGRVPDPFLHTAARVGHEQRAAPCPPGRHGAGRTMTRTVRQDHDGRGNPVGSPAHGPWRILVDDCRADYSEWVHYTLACRWQAGPPHDREMTGEEIWRRLRTVSADGATLGAPEFVSSSCWTGAVPETPAPAVTVNRREESAFRPCPPGETGQRALSRIVTIRSTLWPWDDAPTTRISRGPWTADSSGCEPVPLPPDDDDGDDGTDGDDGIDHGDDDETGDGPGEPGDGDGGDSGDGGGDHGDDGDDQGDDDETGDGPGEPGDGDDGDDGDGGDGGCFLTAAIVGMRGAEGDDGPTLTALRGFRDGYMARTPERRRLVRQYYEIAPRIVAAIPPGDAEWTWIGARIDAAVAAIRGGRDAEAFAVYVELVAALAARWLDPAGAGPVRAARGGRE